MAIWWPTGIFLNQSQHLCADSPPRLLAFVVEISREEHLSATPKKSLEHIDSSWKHRHQAIPRQVFESLIISSQCDILKCSSHCDNGKCSSQCDVGKCSSKCDVGKMFIRMQHWEMIDTLQRCKLFVTM